MSVPLLQWCEVCENIRGQLILLQRSAGSAAIAATPVKVETRVKGEGGAVKGEAGAVKVKAEVGPGGPEGIGQRRETVRDPEPVPYEDLSVTVLAALLRKADDKVTFMTQKLDALRKRASRSSGKWALVRDKFRKNRKQKPDEFHKGRGHKRSRLSNCGGVSFGGDAFGWQILTTVRQGTNS